MFPHAAAQALHLRRELEWRCLVCRRCILGQSGGFGCYTGLTISNGNLHVGPSSHWKEGNFGSSPGHLPEIVQKRLCHRSVTYVSCRSRMFASWASLSSSVRALRCCRSWSPSSRRIRVGLLQVMYPRLYCVSSADREGQTVTSVPNGYVATLAV